MIQLNTINPQEFWLTTIDTKQGIKLIEEYFNVTDNSYIEAAVMDNTIFVHDLHHKVSVEYIVDVEELPVTTLHTVISTIDLIKSKLAAAHRVAKIREYTRTLPEQ